METSLALRWTPGRTNLGCRLGAAKKQTIPERLAARVRRADLQSTRRIERHSKGWVGLCPLEFMVFFPAAFGQRLRARSCMLMLLNP
jgi:hypothetical protein